MGNPWEETRDFYTGRTFRDMINPEEDLPEQPALPAPVEDIDVAGQKQYTKKRLKAKKGRASTVLGSANKNGLKTVLG